jgi:hypothetical protein
MIKTSEFIKMLQREDPNDECYICVGNHPVSWVENLPFYYDGRMEWIERDEHNIPIKVGYPDDKMKLKIHFDTIEDALLDNPDAELILDGITYQGKVQERYMSTIHEWQEEGRKFQEWKRQSYEAHKNGTELPSSIIKTKTKSLHIRIKRWFQTLGLIK